MACSTGSFACDALHGAPITKEAVCIVAEQIIVWLVEHGSGVGLSYSKANCIGEALTKRASGNFNTFGIVAFRVAGSDTVNLLWKVHQG